MNCNNCNIEMQVLKVENNIFTFKCKKCNKQVKITKEELNEKYNLINKSAV